jgi:predicted DNA-binding protein
MSKDKTPQEKGMVAKTFRYAERQLKEIDNLSGSGHGEKARLVRELIDLGLQMVNVRKDGYTHQIILFTDEQNEILSDMSRHTGKTVSELINDVILEKFK